MVLNETVPFQETLRKLYTAKNFLILTILFVVPNVAVCNPNSGVNFWKNIIQNAFENSPKVRESRNNYSAVVLDKKQNDYSWYPYLQLDIQQSLRQSPGSYLYVLNQSSDSGYENLLNPGIFFSINQKLAGNGSLSISAGYGFDYLIERNVFLQQPQIQFNYIQKLGKGTFFPKKTAERLFFNEKHEYARVNLNKELIQELLSVIKMISEYDYICTEENYYKALLRQYEAELTTVQTKNKNGLQSELESYYALHQFTNTKSSLNDVLTNKKNAEKEIRLILPELTDIQIEENRDYLKRTVQDLLSDVSKHGNNYSLSAEQNLDYLLYISQLKLEKYEYQKNELNFAPVLYINSSINPDKNLYYNYSDWYKSLRSLTEYPNPIDFTLSAGIKINFELPGARKIRLENYEIRTDTIRKNYDSILQNQKRDIGITENQIKTTLSYLEKLKQEIEQESVFRKERKELFNKNLMTQDEYYQSETMFFYIYRDYIASFWSLINNQLKLISISSKSTSLLEYFLDLKEDRQNEIN